MTPKPTAGAKDGNRTPVSAHDASGSALHDWLEPDEEVVAVLVGDGATLTATQRRVVIVRDGSEYRPRSGVRSWPYEQVVQVQLSRPQRGQARFVVRTGRYPWQAVSVFFNVRQWPDAERVVREVTRRVRTGHAAR
jgi:hypothetical protein